MWQPQCTWYYGVLRREGGRETINEHRKLLIKISFVSRALWLLFHVFFSFILIDYQWTMGTREPAPVEFEIHSELRSITHVATKVHVILRSFVVGGRERDHQWAPEIVEQRAALLLHAFFFFFFLIDYQWMTGRREPPLLVADAPFDFEKHSMLRSITHLAIKVHVTLWSL